MLGGVAEYCGFITKQGWRCLTGSNTTAYYVKVSIADKQSSITMTKWASAIKNQQPEVTTTAN